MALADQQSQVTSAVNAYLSQQQPLETVLTQLTSQIETAYTAADASNDGSTSAESLLWDLWHTLLSIAQTLSYADSDNYQSRLTSLFSALKERDAPSLSAEKLSVVQNTLPWSQGHLWEDLVLWGWEVRESFDVLDPVINGPQQGTATTTEWVNINAYLARLTQGGVFDHSLLGLSVVRQALESTSPTTTNLGGAVGAAAVWLLLAGRTWYHAGWEDETKADVQEPAGSLWQGRAFKIDRTRVRFWNGRLCRILDEAETIDDEWKMLSRDAISSLEDLEAGEVKS